MSENAYIGYEYTNVTVKRSFFNLYRDSYENFGYELDSTAEVIGKPDCVSLKFRRDRKIKNKPELIRLQRKFDSCAKEILALESSKYMFASVLAYIIGIVGTAFMTGSVFCATGGLVLPCILLAIPAFAGWILPYFVYRNTVRKKTDEVQSFIEEKYDEIYDICEKAHGIVND